MTAAAVRRFLGESPDHVDDAHACKRHGGLLERPPDRLGPGRAGSGASVNGAELLQQGAPP